MKKEFVSYDQALALKKLGFYEPCLGAFHTASNRLMTEFEVINVPEHCISVKAPLKQQVFRWFREKHKLVFFVNMVSINIFYYVIDIYPSDTYKIYEEAEDACIDKLIEIIKQINYDTK